MRLSVGALISEFDWEGETLADVLGPNEKHIG
jgi:hypothetical protein